MAIQAIPGGLFVPSFYKAAFSAPSFGTAVIDAADEGLAAIIRIPKSGNISKVLWATRTVTTGATITVRGETVTETTTPSSPSGTLYHANFTGTSVIADANDNIAVLTSLTAAVAVTRGDKIAILIKQPAASFGNMQVATFADDNSDFPYQMLNTGVSPATSWATVAAAPCVGLEYDDGSYAWIPGCWPIHTITTTTFANSSTPDEVGLRFKLPFPCRISGLWAYIAVSGGDFNINLYDSDGVTKIASTPLVLDKDTRGVASASTNLLYFTATANLLANTFYRLVIEPSSATNVVMYDFTVNAAAAMDALDAGQNFHLTSAKNPTGEGDWTNTTTRRPFMGVLLDGFSDGVGGGAARLVNGGVLA